MKKFKLKKFKKKNNNLHLTLTIILVMLNLIGFRQQIIKYVKGQPKYKQVSMGLCVDGVKYRVARWLR